MTKLTSFLTMGLVLTSLWHSSASAGMVANQLKRIGPICKILFTNIVDRDEGNFQMIEIPDGPMMTRPVKFQLPEGKPPRGGFPAVLMFQGSFSPIRFGRREGSEVLGLQYEVQLIQDLLKAGYAVIAPRAIAGLGWLTNVPPYSEIYSVTPDYYLFENLFSAIDLGKLGAINGQKLFAVGVSSGGYNTSRVGITFADRFRAIAPVSAGYMTCMGGLCTSIPEKLPKNHPPTLLIAGDKDTTVPADGSRDYFNALIANGIEAKLKINPNGGHEWYETSPADILDWFNHYRYKKRKK